MDVTCRMRRNSVNGDLIDRRQMTDSTEDRNSLGGTDVCIFLVLLVLWRSATYQAAQEVLIGIQLQVRRHNRQDYPGALAP